MGRETLNTPVYVQVDVTRCHVVTHLPMRYCLIGEPTNSTQGGVAVSRPVKLLQLAAFAPSSLTASADYNVRVYVVEDTADALQVSQVYERHAFKYTIRISLDGTSPRFKLNVNKLTSSTKILFVIRESNGLNIILAADY